MRLPSSDILRGWSLRVGPNMRLSSFYEKKQDSAEILYNCRDLNGWRSPSYIQPTKMKITFVQVISSVLLDLCLWLRGATRGINKHRHELEEHTRAQGARHPSRKPLLATKNNSLKVERSGSLSEVISHRYLGDALSLTESNILTRKMRSKTLQTWCAFKLCFMSPGFL